MHVCALAVLVMAVVDGSVRRVVAHGVSMLNVAVRILLISGDGGANLAVAAVSVGSDVLNAGNGLGIATMRSMMTVVSMADMGSMVAVALLAVMALVTVLDLVTMS